jgi:putative oxidoreductase
MGLLTTKISNNAMQFGILIMRLAAGSMMLTHGYPKLIGFTTKVKTFPDPIGLGSEFALLLTVFAELLCSALLILGLMTRLALIPLIITMAVVVFVIHGGDPFGKIELGLFYLVTYLFLMLTGPGKFSLDNWILKK